MATTHVVSDLPKVGIVGAGQVGSAMAYATIIRGVVPRIAVYDIDEKRVNAQVADLAHGTIYAGAEVTGGADPEVLRDSDIVVITSGAPQRPGQTRLDLADVNAKIIGDIIPKVLNVAPDAIIVIVTNPCDVLTVVGQKISGLPASRIFSTGTSLDTARLRHIIAQRANVRENNVHAEMAGEHGDSEFALWSSATIGLVPIKDWVDDEGNHPFTDDVTTQIAEDVAQAAYHVIEGKGSTNYAIGLSGANLIERLLSNSRTLMPVSSILDDYYGISGVALSVPTLLSNQGVIRAVPTPMSKAERGALDTSAATLKAIISSLGY
ncbi:L-lactate dehydrogenase/malate dehydrogenase [Propionibacterium cyclohexanicum]|uniref:L-lactate dehydrogenase n=1 Tax=Propionibacterium cyclohexanicum TaxID=64702 RepID=A0A1H9QPZ9_9ACTN|nr:L-lactate dehydrogenase [Propionibacterium cyclohexanicum]SER62524.1 L-lactate dehydrogenase/malate dehydrogenase [Propionibacterium cyclohexanicum]